MGFFAQLGRGRSETTPARALTSVAAVIVAAVVLIVLVVYLIQSAF